MCGCGKGYMKAIYFFSLDFSYSLCLFDKQFIGKGHFSKLLGMEIVADFSLKWKQTVHLEQY